MKRTASIFKLFLSATIFLQLFACKKGMVETHGDPLLSESKQRSSLTPLTTPDIYVAGSEGGQAKYWKNGVGVILPGGNQAFGITVVGSDVYVCGLGTNPVTGIPNAVYWVNGVPTYLPYGTQTTFATGIAVSGGDVYVTGRVSAFLNIGVYWKNGVAIPLGAGEANGIAISNGDIYIANSDSDNPSYWKNGILVPLPHPSNTSVVAIAASGSNVYVTGSYGSAPQKAILWRNGARQDLISPTNSSGYAVAVDALGQPVVLGITGANFNNQQICYWGFDFGSPNIIGFGQQVGSAMGLTVDPQSGSIFACGSEYESASTPPSKAKYWSFGSTGGFTSVTLNSSATTNATAFAIALGQ
jgi:hypothetical protein